MLYQHGIIIEQPIVGDIPLLDTEPTYQSPQKKARVATPQVEVEDSKMPVNLESPPRKSPAQSTGKYAAAALSPAPSIGKYAATPGTNGYHSLPGGSAYCCSYNVSEIKDLTKSFDGTHLGVMNQQ